MIGQVAVVSSETSMIGQVAVVSSEKSVMEGCDFVSVWLLCVESRVELLLVLSQRYPTHLTLSL